MITLYGFGSASGLPDFSPFVIKTMLLLKLAGLDYVVDHSGLQRAPKGKLPYIDDDGAIVADSTLIRWHIEKTRGIDLDQGLTPEQRAASWALEKMCEDHLYWIAVRGRWLDDANFARGPAKLFKSAPALLRPIIGNLSAARSARRCRRRAPVAIPTKRRRGLDFATSRRSRRCSATSPISPGTGPAAATRLFSPSSLRGSRRSGSRRYATRRRTRPISSPIETRFSRLFPRIRFVFQPLERLSDEFHVLLTRKPMVAFRDERHDDRIRRELFRNPEGVTPGHDLVAHALQDMHRRIDAQFSAEKQMPAALLEQAARQGRTSVSARRSDDLALSLHELASFRLGKAGEDQFLGEIDGWRDQQKGAQALRLAQRREASGQEEGDPGPHRAADHDLRALVEVRNSVRLCSSQSPIEPSSKRPPGVSNADSPWPE